MQAGEAVWIKRTWNNFGAPSVFTLVTVIFLLVARADPSTYKGAAGSGALAVWFWLWVMGSRLRFTDTTLLITSQNYGLWSRRVDLQEVVAARIDGLGLDVRLRPDASGRRVRNSHCAVYVCQFSPAHGGKPRWVGLWITPYKIRADTLLAELRRRCDLTELSSASDKYRTELWPSPEVWQRPGFDASLLSPPDAM